MAITVKARSNGDHVVVAWLPSDEAAIPECRGFAVKRSRDGKEEFLHSFIGFTDDAVYPKADPWKWPLQRYLWWDFGVESGQTVRYRVIPVVGPAASLELKEDLASDWTDELEVTTQFSPHISAFFNRGIVAAQWVSRALDKEAQGRRRRQALKDVITKPGDALREALAGQLKPEVIGTIDDAEKGSLYAALYELNDPELLDHLEGLGARANVILANGSFSTKKPDENEAARTALGKTKVKLYDRMVSSGHFAHNKFAVYCDAGGKPQTVLTGSTNWTSTGLCSQANNALVIDDPAVADRFLTQWNRLKDARNGFPSSLITSNSNLEQFTVDDITVTPWFAPTSDEQDLDYARKLIADAKESIFFLFFNPGIYKEDPRLETLLQNVLERRADDLYIRGVVNQEISGLTEEAAATTPPVTLVNERTEMPLKENVLVPAYLDKKFYGWEDEVLGASPVMVHSKVVVLDPWGEHPVLMTGSHNLGVKASSKNDDNLVILEGPAASALATAYAVCIIAIFGAYHWNSYVRQHESDPNVWHGLQDTAAWQNGHLKGQGLAELRLWTGSGAPAPTP